MKFEDMQKGMCLINLRGQMIIAVIDGIIESEDLGRLLDVTILEMRYNKFELIIRDGTIFAKDTFEKSEISSNIYKLSENTSSDFKKNFIAHLMKCTEIEYA